MYQVIPTTPTSQKNTFYFKRLTNQETLKPVSGYVSLRRKNKGKRREAVKEKKSQGKENQGGNSPGKAEGWEKEPEQEPLGGPGEFWTPEQERLGEVDRVLESRTRLAR